jgi:hypothetical protein
VKGLKYALMLASAGISCYGGYEGSLAKGENIQDEMSEEATALLQAVMAGNSAATASLQTDISAASQKEQNETSNEQSYNTSKSTLIQQMSKIFTLGSV